LIGNDACAEYRLKGIDAAEKKKFSFSALKNKLIEKKPSDAQKSMRKFLLFILVLSIFCQRLFAGTFSGKCVGISDGDTISVMKYGRAIKIRL
jgi:endonuclease YncB( thermonuclease family)